MSAAIDEYLEEIWLAKGLSENTLAAYRRDLAALESSLGKALLDATAADLMAVMASRYDQGYRTASSARWLSCIKGFYRRSLEKGRISTDPAAHLEYPKLGRPLPSSLSEAQVEELLRAPDVNTVVGLRDRAMLELLYATGLRVSELVHLEVGSLNLRQGVIRVIGKGGKERLVPVGQEALAWVARFVGGGARGVGRGGHQGPVPQQPGPRHGPADLLACRKALCGEGRHRARPVAARPAPRLRHPSTEPRCGFASGADDARPR